MKRLADWLTRKWSREVRPNLGQDYLVTFSTEHGRRVLLHFLDAVYCTIYEGTDPIAAAMHAGRRSLVHEILQNIDAAESPGKYGLGEPSKPFNPLEDYEHGGQL